MTTQSNALDSISTGSIPIALKLPEETWIQILLEIKDYIQLKRAGGICKQFQRIIKGTEFDDVLFRSKPQNSTLSSDRQVTLHPLLEITDGCFCTIDKAFMYDTFRYHPKQYFIRDYPTILNEYATSPTSTSIKLSFPEGPGFTREPLVKLSGITVKDFLVHVGEYWSTPTEPHLHYQEYDFSIKPGKVMKYCDAMGHYVWDNWKCKVKENGDVHVTGFQLYD